MRVRQNTAGHRGMAEVNCVSATETPSTRADTNILRAFEDSINNTVVKKCGDFQLSTLNIVENLGNIQIRHITDILGAGLLPCLRHDTPLPLGPFR